MTEAPDPIPPPDLEALRHAGIPTVTDDDYRSAVEERTPRRRQLAALLDDEGWRPDAWERRRQKIRAGAEPPESEHLAAPVPPVDEFETSARSDRHG